MEQILEELQQPEVISLIVINFLSFVFGVSLAWWFKDKAIARMLKRVDLVIALLNDCEKDLEKEKRLTEGLKQQITIRDRQINIKEQQEIRLLRAMSAMSSGAVDEDADNNSDRVSETKNHQVKTPAVRQHKCVRIANTDLYCAILYEESDVADRTSESASSVLKRIAGHDSEAKRVFNISQDDTVFNVYLSGYVLGSWAGQGFVGIVVDSYSLKE